jgi:hypothetical protein
MFRFDLVKYAWLRSVETAGAVWTARIIQPSIVHSKPSSLTATWKGWYEDRLRKIQPVWKNDKHDVKADHATRAPTQVVPIHRPRLSRMVPLDWSAVVGC